MQHVSVDSWRSGTNGPTPTPEEFREAFAKAPSASMAPMIAPELKEMAGPGVRVQQVVQFDLPARSREEPFGALEASYEHVSSKLTAARTPAEATRIAALRAKEALVTDLLFTADLQIPWLLRGMD